MPGRIRKLLSRALFKAAAVVGASRDADIAILRDSYIELLGYINAGMLHQGNPYLFDYAISLLPNDSPIIEIGAFCGLSTNVLTYLKHKHGAKNALVNCDKWGAGWADQAEPFGNFGLTNKDYREFSRDSYLHNVRMFSGADLPFTIEKTSDEFFAAWTSSQPAEDVWGRHVALGGPVSFCYIDGNHSYDFVKRDFLNCDQWLSIGGFVLFDDSVSPEWEVRLLMPEVLGTGRYKLVARNPNHLFQKIS